jgi:hypothetical protein
MRLILFRYIGCHVTDMKPAVGSLHTTSDKLRYKLVCLRDGYKKPVPPPPNYSESSIRA